MAPRDVGEQCRQSGEDVFADSWVGVLVEENRCGGVGDCNLTQPLLDSRGGYRFLHEAGDVHELAMLLRGNLDQVHGYAFPSGQYRMRYPSARSTTRCT